MFLYLKICLLEAAVNLSNFHNLFVSHNALSHVNQTALLVRHFLIDLKLVATAMKKSFQLKLLKSTDWASTNHSFSKPQNPLKLMISGWRNYRPIVSPNIMTSFPTRWKEMGLAKSFSLFGCLPVIIWTHLYHWLKYFLLCSNQMDLTTLQMINALKKL